MYCNISRIIWSEKYIKIKWLNTTQVTHNENKKVTVKSFCHCGSSVFQQVEGTEVMSYMVYKNIITPIKSASLQLLQFE